MTTTNPTSHHRYLSDDDEHEKYAPVGIDGLLAASEKLLAVNRGLAEPDERDSLPNDRIHTVDRLMAERVKLDHGKTLRSMMGRVSRARNLSPMGAASFDAYTTGYLTGNPLVTALEEINPMHILEQKRRITKMGPGGIGDPNAITESMQCHSDDTEVFTRTGWKFWGDVTTSDELACRVDDNLEFHIPTALHTAQYEGVMYGSIGNRTDFLVTPNHRFLSLKDGRGKEWRWETASEQFGYKRIHMTTSGPYAGDDARATFRIPAPVIAKTGGHAKTHPEIDMGDWCEFLGWYCSEGSCASADAAKSRHYKVIITQLYSANPTKVAAIEELLGRMPFGYTRQANEGRNFVMHSKSLHTLVLALGHRCWEKRVPEFLFEVKPEYRRRFLNAYALGDAWRQKSGSWVYTTTSPGMADDLERLLLGLGRSCTRGNPWMCKRRNGESSRLAYRVNELTRNVVEVQPQTQKKVEYSGAVYCATVPGSLLLTRRGYGSKPLWTGNSVEAAQFGFIDCIAGPESERAGIDVRLATGTRIGSDGRIYQLLRNRKTGKNQWVSPSDLVGKTLKLPD